MRGEKIMMTRGALVSLVVLLSGCFDSSGWFEPGEPTTVCVEGDAGICCDIHSDVPVCTERGCTPSARLPERCLRCFPWAIQPARDAGPGPTSPPTAPPTQPPPDASIEWIEVCGPATYHDP